MAGCQNEDIITENFDKVCRFCLTQPRKKQKNFENFLIKIVPKYKQQIEDLLLAFNVEVTDENLPKVICNACFDFLPRFFEFHKKCVLASKTLQEVHCKMQVEIKSEDTIKEEELEESEIVVLNEPMLDEGQETDDFTAPITDDDEDDVEADDDDLQNEFDDTDGRTDGENVAHGEKPTKTKRKPRQCNVCGKIVHRLPIHMLSHTKEKKHKCPHCERSFSTKGNLATHVDIHLNNRKYKCHICPKDFVSSSSFRKHLLVHSGTRNHHCDLCDKSFNQIYTLRMHKKMHAQDRPNECSICKKKFYTAFQLRQHQKTHGAKLKCNLCTKEFKTEVYLEIHLRTHTGLSPYNCELCGKKFSSGSSLVNHSKTHARKILVKSEQMAAMNGEVLPNNILMTDQNILNNS